MDLPLPPNMLKFLDGIDFVNINLIPTSRVIEILDATYVASPKRMHISPLNGRFSVFGFENSSFLVLCADLIVMWIGAYIVYGILKFGVNLFGEEFEGWYG